MVQHADIDHTGITGVGGAALGVELDIQAAGANYTTTSSSYADIDGTNLSESITTGAHRVKVTLTACLQIASANIIFFDVLVDGTGLGGNGAWFYRGHPAAGQESQTFVYVTPQLTAAAHTIKLQWKVNGDTGTMSRSNAPLIFLLEELGL